MNKQLRYWIRNYFGFNQTETNGFVVVIYCIILFLFLPLIFSMIWADKEISTSEPSLDSLVTIIEVENTRNSATLVSYKKDMIPFNPNELTLEEWMDIGLEEKIAQRIINYQEKGGKFRKKEDIQKVYGFPKELYTYIEPFIVIETPKKYEKKAQFKKDSSSYKNKKYNKEFKQTVIQPFDLNEADTVALKQIKGIGSKLSARIVKHRDALGGFTNWQQLNEVYGLSPEVIAELQKYASLDKNNAHKININQITRDELKKHPYIREKLAKVIIAYRDQHGKFVSEADLAKIKILDAKTLDKIRDYISYD